MQRSPDFQDLLEEYEKAREALHAAELDKDMRLWTRDEHVAYRVAQIVFDEAVAAVAKHRDSLVAEAMSYIDKIEPIIFLLAPEAQCHLDALTKALQEAGKKEPKDFAPRT